MKNIAFIGFMGSGKSTISKELANKLNTTLIDVDDYIVEKNQMKITDMFDKYGEDYFRDKETEAIRDISKESGIIISCGGGSVLRDENVKLLKENGTIVLLKATPETIYERVKDSTSRPILNGNMNVEFIAGLMEKRRERYESVTDVEIITDNKSVDEIIDEIMQKVVEK